MKLLNTLLITACLAAPIAAQTPSVPAAAGLDVTGTWNATFTTQNGEIPAQIKIEKAAGKLAGTISSQMGQSPIEAEAKDKTLSIWFTMSGQNGPMAIELTGTIDGETYKGSASAGGTAAGTFVATKAKAEPAGPPAKTDPPAAPAASSSPSASLTGTWNASVELPSMTASPTIVLKQDADKLTGEYVSAQYGKFPITGTVKGADVTFWFAMNVEGTALNVTYTGKLEKEELTGSVNYGDMMSGTFTAVKKK